MGVPPGFRKPFDIESLEENDIEAIDTGADEEECDRCAPKATSSLSMPTA
jgi:hypothetical protein